MRRCIHFSQFTRFGDMERGLGAYGFRRRRRSGRRAGARKGRSKMGLTGRSRFINQLGGWSENRGRHERARTFEFTSRLHNVAVNINNSQLQGTSLIPFNPGSAFIEDSQIFNSFQKWKVKKIELFANVTNVSNNPSADQVSRVQLTLSKWRDEAVPANILNVDGAQTKIIHVTESTATQPDAELDILRCATFWPPVTFAGRTPTGSTAQSYLMNTWFDGREVVDVHYNSFAVQLTRSSPSPQNQPIVYTVLYYFKVTFLAKNPSFQGAVI